MDYIIPTLTGFAYFVAACGVAMVIARTSIDD